MATAKTKTTTKPKTQEQSATPQAADGSAGEPAIKSLTVTAKVDGFRRAGRAWHKTAETVSVNAFTEEQIDALLLDPMLDVEVVTE